MLSIACDIINTLCQALLFTWIPNRITAKNNKLTRLKASCLILLIFSEVVAFTYSGINIPFANFILVTFIMLLIILFFRKSVIDAFIGFGVAYSIISISAYFLVTLYQNLFAKLDLGISSDLQPLIFIYIPIWTFYIVAFVLRKYIFNAAMALKRFNQSLIFVLLIDFALIFLDTLHMEWSSQNMTILFKSALYIIAFAAFAFSVVYFAKINDKSKEIELLNTALNDKITELRKIKHDYGSEISSLFGLYQLGKIDRLGELLKTIVERNQASSPAINLSVQATPMVASIINSIVPTSINVIIFDAGNYENLAVTDNELLKVISNIIRNSVEVLKDVENPTIKFKSYNHYDGITIAIINNGPEISKNIIHKIFETGFTTKENSDGDHGYGLGIVKDILNMCNGEISIESNTCWTQFSVKIPYKIAKL